ncbi:Actin cross-linking toxin VgrG1 [Fundidesulfovibrio magnetotacticus]|uniref:Actin cross-linking toxin VgrG1 n=1 Tax=Fundidesulfovibrio magnetotacticus TaxID=2730080 RepID=A0A6V8LX02_9BACT|nr:type VI secretion system tip protein TssI/VgrG [Fundidesulfovibrio magnetotacticus]GFK95420.1 Actin cross-linking toxin VgrG1 [Fundidesulfovibrio magnetotacticus]
MAMERPAFTFTLSGQDPQTFHVVRFTGVEGLSKLYEFEITLLTDRVDLDLETALHAEAVFTIKRPGSGDVTWKGILRQFKLASTVGGRAFHKAVLVPRAWLLTQAQHNRIFLNQDLVQNLRESLKDGGLAQGIDFDLRISGSYPRREYVCQYNETLFNFISRWSERNGLYFYFDQAGPAGRFVLTDSLEVHEPHPGGGSLTYGDVSGLDGPVAGRGVKHFQCEMTRLPHEVLVKDYNYRTPSLDIQATAQVSEEGVGRVYVHGGHMRSLHQAAFLAGVRAQSLGCRSRMFFGESNAPTVQPGYLAHLEKHPREDFNRGYLVVESRHEGAQESWLTAGLGVEGLGDRLFYRNAFAAIPSDVQYRSEIKTPRPHLHGTLLAHVDAEGSGKYAELDEEGRYKVIMPFDVSGRADGRASTWIRMVQPYGGPGHGMHFPLHKGAEVAVIHQEGDPDRPVIMGALHNPEAPSMVTSDNQTQSVITTAGGNRIHMEDKEGSERILLYSQTNGNFIRIGAPNDPPNLGGTGDQTQADRAAGQAIGNTVETMATKGIAITTPQWFSLKAAIANTIILGENSSTTMGLYSTNYIGPCVKVAIGPTKDIKSADVTKFTSWVKHLCVTSSHTGTTHTATLADCTQDYGTYNLTAGETNIRYADLEITALKSVRVYPQDTLYINVGRRVVLTYQEEGTELKQSYLNMNVTSPSVTHAIDDLNQTGATLNQAFGETSLSGASLEMDFANVDLTFGDGTITAASKVVVAGTFDVT